MPSCSICEKRRPQLLCPGLSSDICPRCCGEHREVTVQCPLDCEHLREARRHEKPRERTEEIPHADIEITEGFLRRNSYLLARTCQALFEAAVATPGAADADARQALESMITTHRTLESGIIYTSRPDNLIAATIQQRADQSLEQFRRQVSKETGSSIRDKDLLGVFVFLARVGAAYDNGRPKSRAFLDFVRANLPPVQPPETGSLIRP